MVKFLSPALVLLIFTLISDSSFSQDAVGTFPIHHFSPQDYKAGNQNIDFAQNRDMTLFVANNLGVLAYNGSNWEKHAAGTGQKKRSLAFDDNSHRLYVGSQGEFGYFSDKWVYKSLNDLVPKQFGDFDEVWDVYIIAGQVYFCTFQGIYLYNGHSITVLGYDIGLDRSFVVKDKFYTQNQKGQLFEIADGALTETNIQNKKKQIISAVLSDDEDLLIFYKSGEVELSTSNNTQTNYKKLAIELRGTYVNHVLQLSDNRLAISTQTAGLYLVDPRLGTTERISTSNGLSINACLRSFQDFSGKLWVGLQNGITLVDINSPIRFIHQDINLEGSGYEAIQSGKSYYYTTSNGIYYSDDNSKSCQFVSGTEGPSYGLQKVSGRIYAGHHTGLFLLKEGRATLVAECDGLWQIKQLKSDPRYLIGGSYSGLYLFEIDKNGMVKLVGKISGFSESSRFFEEDDQGKIWVGQYYKSLYQLTLSSDYQEVSVVDISQNSSEQDHQQVILSKVNNELIIASNNGLFKLDNVNKRIESSNKFTSYFENQEVYLCEEDGQKNVHVVSNDRVGLLKQVSSNNYQFVPSSLRNFRYNLNNDLLNISTDIKNGVLYSSNDGFIFYDHRLENNTNQNQNIIVRRLYSALQDTALYEMNPFDPMEEDRQEISISHKDRLLQIDVESYGFTMGGDQEFRYLLKGFEEEYTEWTNNPSKEYSNLKDGEYEFTVQSKNHLGEINTSKALLFNVHPPFYKSGIAKIIYAGLFLLSFYLLYRWQKLRFQRKAIDLAKTKQQELLELEQHKERELALLQEEKAESELQHVNNLLAASTMNLVVKNEFIESIKEELNAAKLLGSNQQTKKALTSIVKGIDSTVRLQEDWERFELHFDKVHGTFLTRIQNQFNDLSPNEQKLCALLRLNLNTKEISNLMSISLRGVEVARYRLRKKLELKKGQNLSKFILEY